MIVILEGPDGGGKTTLASALLANVPESVYVKSPAGKQWGWDEEFNNWAEILHNRFPINTMVVCDRTPEISELVYGSLVRGFSRARAPLNIFSNWPKINPLIVLTGGGKPEGKHYDPMGTEVSSHLDKVSAGYTILEHLFRNSKIGVYNWINTSHKVQVDTQWKLLWKFIYQVYGSLLPTINEKAMEFWSSVEIGKEKIDGQHQGL